MSDDLIIKMAHLKCFKPVTITKFEDPREDGLTFNTVILAELF